MSAADILAELHRRGVTVRLDDENLLLSPRNALDDEILARAREHKSAIVAALAGPATKMEPARLRQHSAPTSQVTSPVHLCERYRPHRVAEFIGHPRAKRVLSNFVANPYDVAFLFYGQPGVGKTSMAQAMAEEMGAEFHHLGSQKCNVENLEEVCRTCRFVPLNGGFHFVLVDEIDSASHAAQLALLSKLDSTDAPKNTVFVFTCNSTEKLEARFVSRCLQIEFSREEMDGDLPKHLEMVWRAEGGNGNGSDFARLAKEHQNNIRNCLNSLEEELKAR